MSVRNRLSAFALAALGVSGCAEPFEVRRQELSGFRIAAVGVVDGKASAASWSGEGLAHEEAPLLEWSLDGECLGEGWDVAPKGSGLLELKATSSAGDVAYAQVSVGQAPAIPAVTRYAVQIDQEVDVESRSNLQETPVIHGPSSMEAVRLRVSETEAQRAHFMVAGTQGTILELDPLTADFVLEDIVFEDTEVVSREPVESGLFHFLVLTQDLAGGNRWLWLDVPMGIEGDWVSSGERRLPLSVDTSTGLVAMNVEATGDFEAVSWSNAESVTDLSSQTPLECNPEGLPFQLDWITNGRCGLSEVNGARLVVEVE